jgi:predicted Zn finger-like uncharacterized protein
VDAADVAQPAEILPEALAAGRGGRDMSHRMRITCPNCAASYEVPERLLQGGPRPVRCARCGTTWAPAAPAAPPPSSSAVGDPDATVAVSSPHRPAERPAPVRAPVAEAPMTPPPAPQASPSPPPATERPGAPPPLRTPPPRPPQVIDPPLPAVGDAADGGGGRGGGLLLLAAWVASIAAVLGMLVALWVFRVEVVAAWPPAARLFDVLGG